MKVDSLQSWIGVVASLSALIVGLVTALWAYSKFVIERGLLPPVQFWLECKDLGTRGDKTLLEISIHLKNVGNSTLIATKLRADLRYLEKDENLELSLDPDLYARFGRAIFKGSLTKDLLDRADLPAVPEPPPKQVKVRRSQKKSQEQERKRGLSVMPHDTFVQSHVDQVYPFVTAIPSSTSHVLVWSSFRYAQRPRPLQKVILWVSRKLGLIQFTLEHVTEPHTTERVFELGSVSWTSAPRRQ